MHPNSLKNLKPFNKLPPEEAKVIQSKGGSTITPQRSISQKLRWLKTKGMTEESAAHLLEVMTESKMSSLDIRIYLERLKKTVKSNGDKFKMAKTMLDWHKATHGDKHEIEHFGAAGIKITIHEPKETDERTERRKL